MSVELDWRVLIERHGETVLVAITAPSGAATLEIKLGGVACTRLFIESVGPLAVVEKAQRLYGGVIAEKDRGPLEATSAAFVERAMRDLSEEGRAELWIKA